MSHIHVRAEADAGALEADLAGADRIALDCEAAGFHRYSDRLCLVQITIADRTYVLDPLAFDPTELLRGPLEDPALPIVMHGADFDLRLLRRDLGVRLRGLMDTQIAASLLAEEGLGLAALLESRIGVKLSKKYQRADWAERPLTEGMLEYAASDTRHLLRLHDLLATDLVEVGRYRWAEEEWLALEEVADESPPDPSDDDPVVRVKGARTLPIRHVAALRVALQWRDDIARARDRALFRVIGDPPLIEVAMGGARSVEDLKNIKGFPRALAREDGPRLLEHLRLVAAAPEEELVPYPKGARRGPGRPPPELESLIERLKQIRNERADQIGLPRGTLLSNAVLQAIAGKAPSDLDALLEIPGMRRWKAEVLGEPLLAALRRDG